MNYRNEKIRAVMQRLACTGNIPGECNGGNTTWAHANAQALGKGMGLKAHDCFVAPLCGPLCGRPGCHYLVDNELPRHVADHVWRRAFENGWRYAHTYGLVELPSIGRDYWVRYAPIDEWPADAETIIALPGAVPDAVWLMVWKDGLARVQK